MRVALISDVHGNLDAFDAVIADFGVVDEVWSLGDLVGYGPNPNECVERIHRFKHICVAGNHDWAAIGKLSTEGFNPLAASAIAWTSTNMSADTRTYLESLPTSLRQEDLTLVHGSPRDHVHEYLFHPYLAVSTLAYLDTQHCLVGHTHVAAVFYLNPPARRADLAHPAPGEVLSFTQDRMIINPGSVGQPRDGIPDARYILLDTEAATFCYRRVSYDIAATQAKMQQAGLPERLSYRLASGV